MSNNKTVVVLSRSYSNGLSVIRSLGMAGYVVDLIYSTPSEGGSQIIAASKYVRNSVEIVSKKVKLEEDVALLDALLSYAENYDQKVVLFPTDDYTASVMDHNRQKLEPYYIMPRVDNGETLVTCMDKTFQSKIARKVGMPAAREWVVSLREEEISIPEDMVYPCYCKPMSSVTGYKTEMARCDDREALATHLKLLKNNFSDRSILVQEFLFIDEEIDMSGVCLDQEIIIPAVTRKIKIAQFERGVVITGKAVPLEELGDTGKKLEALFRELRYTGMFHMDINRVGDEYYFGEINMRSGGPNFIYYASGVNLPEIFVKHVMGEEISPEERTVNEYGRDFVYEKVAWEDYLHGYMTREELDSVIENADVKFLYSEDDKEPENVFLQTMEKKAEFRELKEKCINETASETGWSHEKAAEEIKLARERTGISYNDYLNHKFYLIPADNQEEEYDKIIDDKERNRERNRENKEQCITVVMEITGWDREKTEVEIADARERLGITYNDYRRSGMAQIPAEEQQEAYEKFLERRERRKRNKEECIAAAMEAAGWDREKAEAEISDAQSRLGITYNDYRRSGMAQIPVDKQEEEYKKYLERRERRKRNREECIAKTVADTGWDREKAAAEIADAQKRLGITFSDYRKSGMAKIPVDKQEAEYKKYMERKERRKRIKEACITSAMSEAGWTRQQAEAEINDARERLGITYKEYMENSFALIPIKKQEKKYNKILEKREKKR